MVYIRDIDAKTKAFVRFLRQKISYLTVQEIVSGYRISKLIQGTRQRIWISKVHKIVILKENRVFTFKNNT